MEGPNGRGFVLFNFEDRIQFCFLQHLLHVFCRVEHLQFAVVVSIESQPTRGTSIHAQNPLTSGSDTMCSVG
jgi:hypothetical protein